MRYVKILSLLLLSVCKMFSIAELLKLILDSTIKCNSGIINSSIEGDKIK